MILPFPSPPRDRSADQRQITLAIECWSLARAELIRARARWISLQRTTHTSADHRSTLAALAALRGIQPPPRHTTHITSTRPDLT